MQPFVGTYGSTEHPVSLTVDANGHITAEATATYPIMTTTGVVDSEWHESVALPPPSRCGGWDVLCFEGDDIRPVFGYLVVALLLAWLLVRVTRRRTAQ